MSFASFKNARVVRSSWLEEGGRRPDMAGLACSEDVLRVVPDVSCIPPGYLYAFLSSRFGVSLVVSGTYGAIIQHIEPEHISGLPVPRFANDFERRISSLIEEAALQRYSFRPPTSKQRSARHWRAIVAT